MASYTLTPTTIHTGKLDVDRKWHASIKCGIDTIWLENDKGNESRSALEKPSQIYYVPLLKSALQKAIRRRDTTIAVKIAYQFLRQDTIEFLRRLPIYMLEDTYLQPTILIRCIWLMCAVYKGWRLSEDDIRFLLGTVQTLCELEYYELLDMDTPCDTLEKRIGELKGALSPLEAGAICMWIRSEFGGLRGDILFLRNLANTWLDRDADGWELEETWIAWKDPLPSCNDLYYYEGVDFHCYPGLLKEIGLHGHMTNEEFRRAMWYGQSCINVRDWLLPNDKTEEKTKYIQNMISIYQPIMLEMQARITPFAKKAWVAKNPAKTIDMYFAKKECV